jgi:alpha-L-fucosidase
MILRDPALRRLRHRRVPTWWRDAKLGIMVHWTPASVPAFAPTDFEIGDLLRSDRRNPLAHSPYAEWYENSLRFPGSPVARHHLEVYGDRSYVEFARDWEAGLDQWDPDRWARHFARSGARYVVFVAKHADGYCLWPTDVDHPRRAQWHCSRDVVGEMSEAVRAAGMRFGIYYCGGFDWSFEDRGIGSMGDVPAAVPRGDYPSYAESHVRELIMRYRPSVLWNDVAWPASGRRLWTLLESYYAQVPDGVVNDRWLPWSPLFSAARLGPVRRFVDYGSRRAADRKGGLVPPLPPHYDVRTPEYVSFTDIQRRPWESVRGIDRSFGYNAHSRPDHLLSHRDLLWQLVDVVAKGGNLLLNVGPRGIDAQIPDEQLARLDWLGSWLEDHHLAIAATRPWVVPGLCTLEQIQVRYTARGDSVFAFLQDASGWVTLPDARAAKTTTVETVTGSPLPWQDSPAGLAIHLPTSVSGSGPTVCVLRGVSANQQDHAAVGRT